MAMRALAIAALLAIIAPPAILRAAPLLHTNFDGKTVHVVFSNHLDIGFDGIDPLLGSDDNVINRYFDVYFPRAIETARVLNASGHGDRYIWTTQSYLVSLFLDCPPGVGLRCPGAQARAAMEAGIREGAITWHAFPHNAQFEVMDADMVEFGIDLTNSLDRRFGQPPKVTLSQRDVPGLTRAAVPVLTHPGWQTPVKAIHVGVNSGSAPPDVPRGAPFLWRDAASGSQLIAMWHPGGYSGTPVDAPGECMQVRGFDHVLCCAWRGDNAGPHSPQEVRGILARVRAQFPGAVVRASTLDAFVGPLSAAVASGLQLPVVTQEIGDTWINGIASDAGKLADYRALQRMRRKLMYDHSQDAAFQIFSRFLLKVPEHTWGVDVKEGMPDYRNWSNADFRAAGAAGLYDAALHTWRRQRRYLDWAVQALGGSSPGAAVEGELAELARPAAAPNVAGPHFERLRSTGRLRSHAWDIEVNPETGALSRLQRRWRHRRGADWAGANGTLGQVTYSTYTEADYDAIWERYAYQSTLQEWFYKDFGKPNCSRFAAPRRADSVGRATGVWLRRHAVGDGFQAAVRLALPAWTVAEAGAPAQMWLTYTSPPDSESLFVDVTWVNKTSTRLPEALWVNWRPSPGVAEPSSWRIWKMGLASHGGGGGAPIDPRDVVRNGSRSLHAADDHGFFVAGAGRGRWERLNIRTLDAPLVSPGIPTPFPNPDRQPDLRHGMHSLLANNIWGTNYVMWQPYRPEDATKRFRFVIQMEDLDAEPRDWAVQSAEWDLGSTDAVWRQPTTNVMQS